jgi:hypothetical protein
MTIYYLALWFFMAKLFLTATKSRRHKEKQLLNKFFVSLWLNYYIISFGFTGLEDQ